MIRIEDILLSGLVICFLVTGCGQKQEPSEESGTKQEMSQMKDAITKQADEMVAKGAEIVEKARSGAVLMKEKAAAIIKELVAKANSLLEQGRFNEAIARAQKVLDNYDSDSLEAKGIITRAREKLKTMAETVTEKVKKQLGTTASEETYEEREATTTENVKGIKDDSSKQALEPAADTNDGS